MENTKLNRCAIIAKNIDPFAHNINTANTANQNKCATTLANAKYIKETALDCAQHSTEAVNGYINVAEKADERIDNQIETSQNAKKCDNCEYLIGN